MMGVRVTMRAGSALCVWLSVQVWLAAVPGCTAARVREGSVSVSECGFACR